MKTKLISTITIITFVMIILQSCGLSVSSESSCKSTLCEGNWQDFGGWGHHVKLIFNEDGTFVYNKTSMSNGTYDSPSGLPLGSYSGVWSLGEINEENNFQLEDDNNASDNGVMTRHIKMSFNESTSRGKDFDVQLTISPKTKYVVLYGLPDSDQIVHYDGGSEPATE